jgi:hypothetical protein
MCSGRVVGYIAMAKIIPKMQARTPQEILENDTSHKMVTFVRHFSLLHLSFFDASRFASSAACRRSRVAMVTGESAPNTCSRIVSARW